MANSALNVAVQTVTGSSADGGRYVNNLLPPMKYCKPPRNVTSDEVVERPFEELLWVYVAPLILLFGLVGNVLIIAVISRRRFAHTNVQAYMLALAIFDTLVLVTGMVPEWLMNSNIVRFRDISPTTCAMEKLFAYVTGDTAIWILCAFTVDRCFAICMPLRSKDSCKPRHSWLVCATLFTVAIAKNAHVMWTRGPEYCLVTANVTRLSKMCGFPGPQSAIFFEKFVRPWIAAVSVSLLPFTILLVCNILIIVQLMNAQRVRAAVQTSAEKSFRQTIIMCLSISFVFLFTTLPSIVLVIGRPYWKPSDDPVPNYDITKAVINQLTYVNHSINFWLYCVTGRVFRNELLVMFGVRKMGSRAGSHGGLNTQLGATGSLQGSQLRRSRQTLVGSKVDICKGQSRESINRSKESINRSKESIHRVAS